MFDLEMVISMDFESKLKIKLLFLILFTNLFISYRLNFLKRCILLLKNK